MTTPEPPKPLPPVPPIGTPSEGIIEWVRNSQGPRTLLSFSRGKDSIAAWLAIRPHFDEVVPFYLYGVPDLEFVEESLAYFEKFFGCRIIRMPHPTLYKRLRNFTFQTPPHARVLDACEIPNVDYPTIAEAVRADAGLHENVFYASGVRMFDSLKRMTMAKTKPMVTVSRKIYYPVYDWRMDKLVDEMTKSGVRLPVDYWMFGRTFDGVDAAYLIPLKKHFPRDYAKILEFYPLAEASVWRFEKYGKADDK